ncbi:MAG: precorrin-3B synthase, partial [Bauldia sp.]|nr:precorrin-3B synthase [Bauldia sp.]
AGSVEAFATALATAGIVDARPAVLVSPLAGLDPPETADLRAVADAIRRGVDGTLAASLAPKISVVVDGGGGLHLDAIDADVRLAAHGSGAVALAAGGTADTARSLGTVAIERAAGAALTVLRHLAGPGHGLRGRDLDATALG